VASKSEVGQALLYAREKGKAVTVFVEAKARFDEASNLNWGKKLKEAGATVLYSFKYIKVHTKLLLISRNEGDVLRHYSYIGTGNFNEKTAKLYTDHALMTSSKSLGKEIKQVFDLLERKILIPKTKDLLVSPFTTRRKFEKLIQREIKNVKMGKPAYIIAKMNSLEDGEMIAQLVEASQAGVDIQLIVRGICRLVPGIKGYTDNIKVISIIDRFLEHGRVYIFCNDGKEVIYISSADWMKRNLDWRVEVAVPIKDPDLHNELRAIINLQLHDNTKARQIVKSQDNPYVLKKGPLQIRTQEAVYEYLKR
jgi:polyphosphate kinase